jgi:DNA-binding NarL/FixJ family response regulator
VNEHLKAIMSTNSPHHGAASLAESAPRLTQILCVALIDDHKLTRECFVSAAFITQPLLAITPYHCVDEFLESRHGQTDLVVFVYHGYGLAGLEDLLLVLRHFPARNIIILVDSIPTEALPLLRQFESRSATVIQAQETSLQTFVSSLYVIHHGRKNDAFHQPWSAVQESSTPDTHADDDMADLTKRERTVLNLVRQGQSNKEIAQALQTSISTVKAHVRNIMQKTGSSNRIQLALGVHRQPRAAMIHHGG